MLNQQIGEVLEQAAIRLTSAGVGILAGDGSVETLTEHLDAFPAFQQFVVRRGGADAQIGAHAIGGAVDGGDLIPKGRSPHRG